MSLARQCRRQLSDSNGGVLLFVRCGFIAGGDGDTRGRGGFFAVAKMIIIPFSKCCTPAKEGQPFPKVYSR